MKVLHVIHWPKSGISCLVRNLVGEMNQGNVTHFVVFLVKDLSEILAFEGAGVRAMCVDLDRNKLQAILRFKIFIDELAPDILHSHSLVPLIICAFFSKQVPHYTTVHGEYPFLSNKSSLKRLIFSIFTNLSCRNVICVSELVKHKVSYSLADKSKVVVIHNSVPCKETSYYEKVRLETRFLLGIPQDVFVFVSVGRLSPEKGFNLLIDGFGKAFEDNEDCYLVLVGEGGEERSLRERGAQLRCKHRIVFTGYATDPYLYLCAANAYVCSSQYEGFGLSIVEAMNCKLPVLSTNVGVLQDVDFLSLGNIVFNNQSTLEKGLTEFYNKRYDLVKVGIKNAIIVKKLFSSQKMVSAYLSLYMGTSYDL